jgi:hypothetical protein
MRFRKRVVTEPTRVRVCEPIPVVEPQPESVSEPEPETISEVVNLHPIRFETEVVFYPQRYKRIDGMHALDAQLVAIGHDMVDHADELGYWKPE